MGTYVNPGTERLRRSKANKYYVDKSMILSVLNEKINTDDNLICVSRPRRFGKTMAANMIAAYYSKGCDSHEVFSDLKISKDPSFEDNINKYTVIKLDINDVVTNKGKLSVSEYIDEKVISELRKEYPSVTLKDGVSLSTAIMEIYSSTGDQFVFIIDEYDVIIRDKEYSSKKWESVNNPYTFPCCHIKNVRSAISIILLKVVCLSSAVVWAPVRISSLTVKRAKVSTFFKAPRV